MSSYSSKIDCQSSRDGICLDVALLEQKHLIPYFHGMDVTVQARL